MEVLSLHVAHFLSSVQGSPLEKEWMSRDKGSPHSGDRRSCLVYLLVYQQPEAIFLLFPDLYVPPLLLGILCPAVS